MILSQAHSYMDPTASYVYGISFGQLLPVRPVNAPNHHFNVGLGRD